MIKKLLEKIDKLFCCYLGLNVSSIKPHFIEMHKGRLFVSSTESFKRHSCQHTWDQFQASDFNQVNQSDKEKLGIAMGKAIAKNLIISFEETPRVNGPIKRKDFYA